MPNKRAAIKALHQTRRRNQRNTQVRVAVKSLIKLTRRAMHASDNQELPQLLHDSTTALAKAAKRHVIPVNATRRLTSRLMRQAHKIARHASS